MMNQKDRLYVISVYSENQVGLLTSISSIFTRRNINIESLTVFPSEFPGIHHFTFRLFTNQQSAERLVMFIEKKVDVIKAFYYVEDERHDKELDAVEALINERMNKQNK